MPPPPPFGLGGRAHSLAAKGVGESQFQRGDIHCGALYICCERDKQLADGRGRRCRVANTTARKTSINQSILSVINPDITIIGRRRICFILKFRDGVDFVESEIDSE